jgi:hypothetical protein
MLQAAKYRNRAALAVEAFQKDDEIGPQDRREAGFEYFVRCLLERLEEDEHLTELGLSVMSKIEVVNEAGAPSIQVRQQVRALREGESLARLGIEDFYADCFPRNAVFDGAFSIKRSDTLVQRYLDAVESQDESEGIAVIALLSRAAEAAFTPANIRFFFSAP